MKIFTSIIVVTLAIGSFWAYRFFNQRSPTAGDEISSIPHTKLTISIAQAVIPMLAILAIWTNNFWISHFVIGELKSWLCIIGGVIFFLIFLWSIFTLNTNYRPCFESFAPENIVEVGPYRYVRHPIYVANIGMLLSVSFVSGSLWCLLLTAPLLFVYSKTIAIEERFLIRRFRSYFPYICRTGRYFPKLHWDQLFIRSILVEPSRYRDFAQEFAIRSGYRMDIQYLDQGFGRIFSIDRDLVAGFVTNSKPELRYFQWIPEESKDLLLETIEGCSSEISCIWIDRKLTFLQRAMVYWLAITDACNHQTNNIFGGSFSRTVAQQQRKSMPNQFFEGASHFLGAPRDAWVYCVESKRAKLFFIRALIFEISNQLFRRNTRG